MYIHVCVHNCTFINIFFFLVPQGRESDWLYGSAEGQTQLASSAKFRRLVVVAMHRDQEYEDMQAVQSELSPMLMELAPPGMPANQQVHRNNMNRSVFALDLVRIPRSCMLSLSQFLCYRCRSCLWEEIWGGGKSSGEGSVL